MKKIPTVFKKVFENGNYVGVENTYTDEVCKNAFLNGIATLKIYGSAVAIINGKLYVRYDAKLDKNGKPKAVPTNAIPCCRRDPVTGHMPCWIPAELPKDKWAIEALINYGKVNKFEDNATYEAIGPHFRRNPYNLAEDTLYQHGSRVLEDVPRDFAGVRRWLENNYVEGIVFWFNNEPVCKLRRRDFRLDWNKL